MELISVKEWLFDKINSEARSQHAYIEYPERTELGPAKVTNGFVKIIGTVKRETEKAIFVEIECDATLGECWFNTWLPKSQIARA